MDDESILESWHVTIQEMKQHKGMLCDSVNCELSVYKI
jgi:hypothetical protein